MGGYAWVTLATNNSYSLGALVLAHSLKKSNTAHKMAVLITPAVSEPMREQLGTVFDVVKMVDVLDSKDEAHLALMQRPDLGITFTKIHCWRLTEFEKCVFLDADTLVVRNCDELFEREEFSAAPDVSWPDCFNSGVFVYRPSVETFSKILQFAVENRSFDGGDQGLLNQFFSDWATEDIKKHLPFVYNLTSVAAYSYIPAFKHYGSETRIVHFIGTGKPWLQQLDAGTRTVTPTSGSEHLAPLLQQWWDLFCEKVHPNLDKNLESNNDGMSHPPVEANSLPIALTDEPFIEPRTIEPCTPYREKDDFRQHNLPYQPFDVKGSSGELLNVEFLLASVVPPSEPDEQQRQQESETERPNERDERESYENLKNIEEKQQDESQQQEEPPPLKDPFDFDSFFPDETCINNYLEKNVITYRPYDGHQEVNNGSSNPEIPEEVPPPLPRFLTIPEDDRRQSGNTEFQKSCESPPRKEPTPPAEPTSPTKENPLPEKRELTKSKSMPYLHFDVTAVEPMAEPPRSIWKSQPDVSAELNRKFSMPKLKPILPKPNSFVKSAPSAMPKVTIFTEFLMSAEYKDPVNLPKDKDGFVETYIRKEANLRRCKSEVDIRSKFGPLPYACSPEIEKPVVLKKNPFRHLDNEFYDLAQCKRQLGNKPKPNGDVRRKENVRPLPALKPLAPGKNKKSTLIKKRKSKELSPQDGGREKIAKRETRSVKNRKRVTTARNVSTNGNNLDEILERLKGFSKDYQHFFGVEPKKPIENASDTSGTVTTTVSCRPNETETFRQFRNYVRDMKETSQKGLLGIQDIYSKPFDKSEDQQQNERLAKRISLQQKKDVAVGGSEHLEFNLTSPQQNYRTETVKMRNQQPNEQTVKSQHEVDLKIDKQQQTHSYIEKTLQDSEGKNRQETGIAGGDSTQNKKATKQQQTQTECVIDIQNTYKSKMAVGETQQQTENGNELLDKKPNSESRSEKATVQQQNGITQQKNTSPESITRDESQQRNGSMTSEDDKTELPPQSQTGSVGDPKYQQHGKKKLNIENGILAEEETVKKLQNRYQQESQVLGETTQQVTTGVGEIQTGNGVSVRRKNAIMEESVNKNQQESQLRPSESSGNKTVETTAHSKLIPRKKHSSKTFQNDDFSQPNGLKPETEAGIRNQPSLCVPDFDTPRTSRVSSPAGKPRSKAIRRKKPRKNGGNNSPGETGTPGSSSSSPSSPPARPSSPRSESERPKDWKTTSGIAGAIAQLSLETGNGQNPDSAAASSAHQEYLRRQNWETGNMDYMGKDSFDNIWSKICQTLEGKEAEDSIEKAKQEAEDGKPTASLNVLQKCPEYIDTLPEDPVAGPLEDDEIIFSKMESKQPPRLTNIAEEEGNHAGGGNVKLSDILLPGAADTKSLGSVLPGAKPSGDKSQPSLESKMQTGVVPQSSATDTPAEKTTESVDATSKLKLQSTAPEVKSQLSTDVKSQSIVGISTEKKDLPAATSESIPKPSGSETKPQPSATPTDTKSQSCAEKTELSAATPESKPVTANLGAKSQPSSAGLKSQLCADKTDTSAATSESKPKALDSGITSQSSHSITDTKSQPCPEKTDLPAATSETKLKASEPETKSQPLATTTDTKLLPCAEKTELSPATPESKPVTADLGAKSQPSPADLKSQPCADKTDTSAATSESKPKALDSGITSQSSHSITDTKSQPCPEKTDLSAATSETKPKPSDSEIKVQPSATSSDTKLQSGAEKTDSPVAKSESKPQPESPAGECKTVAIHQPFPPLQLPSANKPECTTVAIPSPPIVIPGAPSAEAEKPQISPEPIPLPPPITKTSRSDSLKDEGKQKKGVFTKILEMVGVAPKEKTESETKSVFYDEQAQEVKEPSPRDVSGTEEPVEESVRGEVSSEIEEILEKAKTSAENLLDAGESSEPVNTMKLLAEGERPTEEIEELRVTTEEERKRHKGEPASSKLTDQILKAIPPPRRKAISDASASGSASTSAIPKSPEQKTPAGEGKGKHSKPSSIPVPPPRSRGKPTPPAPSKGKGKK